MAEEKFVIQAPKMCDACDSLIVHGCRFGPADPWMALLFVASAALVQGRCATTGSSRGCRWSKTTSVT